MSSEDEPVVHTSPYPPPAEMAGLVQCKGKNLKPVSKYDWEAYRKNFEKTVDSDPMMRNLMNEYNLVRERYWTDEQTLMQQNNILQQSVAASKSSLRANIEHVYALITHYSEKFDKMKAALKNETVFCEEYTKRFQMNVWYMMYDLRRTWLLMRKAQSELFYFENVQTFTDDAIETARATRQSKKRKSSGAVPPSQLEEELADFDTSEEVEADLEEKERSAKKRKPAAAKRVSKKVERMTK